MILILMHCRFIKFKIVFIIFVFVCNRCNCPYNKNIDIKFRLVYMTIKFFTLIIYSRGMMKV